MFNHLKYLMTVVISLTQDKCYLIDVSCKKTPKERELNKKTEIKVSSIVWELMIMFFVPLSKYSNLLQDCG